MMNKIYFPILKALPGEFTALEHASQKKADQMMPLFEISKITDQIRNRKKYKNRLVKKDYLDDTCEEIGRIWAGRHAMFDTYQWKPTETIESGEHVVPYTCNALNNMGVNTVPVVGYDRWEAPDYQLALKNVSEDHQGEFCIRLDHAAFEDAADPKFLRKNLQHILAYLEISPANCRIILDFGDITPLSVNDLLNKFESLFTHITSLGFLSYSIAGCSLPKSIDVAVKQPNTCGKVLRKEILLWKSIRQGFYHLPIYFGDYGVRGPNSNEGVPSKYTNGKIRYTIENEYHVERGQQLRQPPKGEQMWQLAQKIIDSGYYRGSVFSWGDHEILRCSKMEFKGNAGDWISIDTNHHLAFVVAEINEFERTLVSKPVNV